MNKKLSLKLLLLLLLLLSLSLISCGQKNLVSQSNNETQSSIKKEENNINQDTFPDVKEKNNINQDDAPPELFAVAGGSNEVPGVCEYYLYEINITPRIKPSIITKNSSYYDVKTITLFI